VKLSHAKKCGQSVVDVESRRADASMVNVADDPDLLRLMMNDAERSSALWQPTAYWRGYSERIRRELASSGLAGFRTNQRLLKGFGLGGVPEPALPTGAWKRFVWRTLEWLPGVHKMLAEQRRVLKAEYEHHKDTRQLHAKLAMDEIARAFPHVDPPRGLDNGGADDAFLWRGYTLVPAAAMYFSRAADFYTRVPAERVISILEIGPGFGLSSLAHLALNPALKIIVNVDIVPVLYLSTQFLKSISNVEVVDYRALRDRGSILLEPAQEGARIYQLAPWQLPRLQGPIDFFFNSFSFHEMECDICRNYAAEVLRVTKGGVMLHSSIVGHKTGAGGQRAPVTLEFLESMFLSAFPRVVQLDGFWTRLYGGEPAMTRLMTL
jgi:putative sugar O-methyltransferase